MTKLDANVLLDVALRRQPNLASSKRVVDWCKAGHA